MAGIGECILVGPESLPFTGANTNVAAAVAVAGVGGKPQGPYPLGTQLIMKDGRKFRYASAGATTLVVGNIIQSAVELTTDVDLTPAAGAINDNLITFTHGAATTIANFFAEGFVTVTVTPGGGDCYKISDHLALTNATAGDVVNLWPGHFLRRALTTVSRIALKQHIYSRVIQFPVTTPTGVVAGVAVVALTGATGRGNFGWLQTKGLCGVLTDNSSLLIGQPASAASATAGACSLMTTDIEPVIGFAHSVAASAAWSTIFLTLDG